MRSYILPGCLFVILVLTTVFMTRRWIELGDVEISTIGWILMAGGGVFTILIGGGLMALAFYSDRRGHDDATTISRFSILGETRRTTSPTTAGVPKTSASLVKIT